MNTFQVNIMSDRDESIALEKELAKRAHDLVLAPAWEGATILFVKDHPIGVSYSVRTVRKAERIEYQLWREENKKRATFDAILDPQVVDTFFSVETIADFANRMKLQAKDKGLLPPLSNYKMMDSIGGGVFPCAGLDVRMDIWRKVIGGGLWQVRLDMLSPESSDWCTVAYEKGNRGRANYFTFSYRTPNNRRPGCVLNDQACREAVSAGRSVIYEVLTKPSHMGLDRDSMKELIEVIDWKFPELPALREAKELRDLLEGGEKIVKERTGLRV